MGGDLAALAGDIMPYLTSAIGAYGGAVLADVRDETANATVKLGRRLLQRIFGRRGEASIPTPLADVAADPNDEDAVAALRLAVRKALQGDPDLQRDVAEMMISSNAIVTASGDRSIGANEISGVAITGNPSQVLSIGGSKHSITINPSPGHGRTDDISGLAPRTVQIATLLPPGTGTVVRNRNFEDTHFFGPAIIYPIGVNFDDCGFDIEQDNLEGILWEVTPRFGVGIIVIDGCTFRRCRFSAIGIMGLREALDVFRNEVKPR